MAVIWVTPAGSLGTFVERYSLDIPLNANSPQGPISFSIIAGELPRGLKLINGRIVGSPVEVITWTVSKFVIRASDGVDIEDRTFSMSVDGSDSPKWITKEGFLNVGSAEAYFVLDNSYIDFQLEAYDPDVIAGDVLEYYVAPMGGQLPPGLVLSKSGRIYGFTDPIFSVEYGNTTGAYDTAAFDVTPLDKMEVRSNGFDNYLYDTLTYDYSELSQVPRRLSRFYSFVVTVTDGRNEVKRLFKIWVVTEEFLKADNSIVQVDTNVFQADASSNRNPLWITDAYLGRHRANNYLTIFLDVYRAPGITGTLVYFLEKKNPDNSDSTLPPGMTIDQTTGEVAGRVPYQAAVTKNYKFTVSAVNFLTDILTQNYDLKGTWSASITYAVNQAVTYEGYIWICIQENRNRTPSESPNYWQSSVSISQKTFNIDLIGEIESAIEWITESNLGIIKPNVPSTLFVVANSYQYGHKTIYELVSGTLPPGLVLLGDGNLQGKVKQFSDANGPGLTRFYNHDSSTVDSTLSKSYDVTWDGATTTFDKSFKFSIKARDTSRFAESIRDFTVTVRGENDKTFANLYVKAFQKKSKRLDWFNFITDSSIFKTADLYRYGDTNFGVQTEPKVLLFAGIESREAVKYVQAMSRNHYRKRLTFGKVTYAKAKDPITQTEEYEIVYVEIVDSLEKNSKSISKTVELPNNINSPVLVSYDAIKIDSNIPLVSDRDHQRLFPNSIKNMRKQIETVGSIDRTFLPLWMRTIQDNAAFEPGYVKALPLCFAKPGKAESIISRIKLNGFDFKTIDFEIDRYLIDVIGNVFEDKYLAFPQRGEKLP